MGSPPTPSNAHRPVPTATYPTAKRGTAGAQGGDLWTTTPRGCRAPARWSGDAAPRTAARDRAASAPYGRPAARAERPPATHPAGPARRRPWWTDELGGRRFLLGPRPPDRDCRSDPASPPRPALGLDNPVRAALAAGRRRRVARADGRGGGRTRRGGGVRRGHPAWLAGSSFGTAPAVEADPPA